jgi:hypothetical protein
MIPEYAKNEVYKLIASWAESCGFEIRYKDYENEGNAAYTSPNEYGPSYIQMYSNDELYIDHGKYFNGSFGVDSYFAEVGACNVLAHELAHQVFTNVSCTPFAKLFDIEPVSFASSEMVHNEDACDAFGNFLYTLANRIING